MRYLSHQFAHWETLARVRSWLDLLGFDPGRIEVNAGALPRMTVLVEPEQVLEVRQLMGAAEQSDPDGWPSFWEKAPFGAPLSAHGVRHASGAHLGPEHFEIGWHPQDRDRSAPSQPFGATEQGGLKASG
ncbi:MAG TPA: hypothetical protein VGZ22_16345 [Isosphaeraceae bacterium]|nr:hypothetical protein [Isosphaeraceae bacterium]